MSHSTADAKGSALGQPMAQVLNPLERKSGHMPPAGPLESQMETGAADIQTDLSILKWEEFARLPNSKPVSDLGNLPEIDFHGLHETLKSRCLQAVLLAVRANGSALEFAPPALKANREVVLMAVRSNPAAFDHASPELKTDPAVIAAAGRDHGLYLLP